jgi:imidazolonepropionase-like amidohydrolase
MRKHALVLLALPIALPLASAALRAQTSPATAFVNVTVIPMDREGVLPDQTVIVRDGKIVEIGPAARTKAPTGTTTVDGKGKFLMPALAEMHAHIPGGQAPDALVERTLYLYAANGIGTIRGMLGDPRHLTYRERAAKGEIVSPRIYTTGPSLNGNSVPTKEAAIAAVTAQKAAGYDLLKIHPGIKRDVFDALAAKADELRIRFAGHVPLDVGLLRALEAKYWSIDHLDGYVEGLAKKPEDSQFFGINLMDQIDESKLPALVKATRAAGTWQVPTEALLDNMTGSDDPEAMAKWPEMKYMPAEQIQKWIAQKQGLMTQYPAATRDKFIALRRKILKALYDGGVPFALGSDAPQVWNVPGFSAHRELQALVKAGLTPFQALQTGTANVGVYFGTADATGTVARGKRADLMLLDANPLIDIANSSKIAGVMLNGRWIGRAEIDQKLTTFAGTQP